MGDRMRAYLAGLVTLPLVAALWVAWAERRKVHSNSPWRLRKVSDV